MTTPNAGALVMSLFILLLIFGLLNVVAGRYRQRLDNGQVAVEGMTNHFVRASVIASRGAEKEADANAQTLVFFGPSSMRCWLPHPDQVSGLASEHAGVPVKVVSLCTNEQSMPLTAALVDRFGADFDGWIVLGINRKTIAGITKGHEEAYLKELTAIGFDSEILEREGELAGFTRTGGHGPELWDRRNFYYYSGFGMTLPFLKPQPYQPYVESRKIDIRRSAARVPPFKKDRLAQSLAALERLAARIKSSGRARLALVETPWLDDFVPEMQSEAWHAADAAYRNEMAMWSERNGVKWLSDARNLKASVEDFSDGRHVGNPELRLAFLRDVTRELIHR